MTLALAPTWLAWLTAPKDGPILALLAVVVLALVLGLRSRASAAKDPPA
ncbi:MAG TPA: hypothetical protein VGB85_24030 [Nannocystis sp.]|jgi:hypothetical protein